MKLSNVEWLDRFVYFDFEVTRHDWLLCLETHVTEEKVSFHNDNLGVKMWLEDNPDCILVGYNNKAYDDYILKGVLSDFSPERIKEINDFIVKDDQQGWMYSYGARVVLPSTCDLMLDMPQRQSLKEIEGNLGLNIVESTISFDIETKWTQEEYLEMEYYCQHDTGALRHLAKARFDYLQAKVTVGNRIGDTADVSLYQTNAKLTAKVLKAESRPHTDDAYYEYPTELNKGIMPREVLEYVDNYIDSGTSYQETQVITIADVPHTLGIGGLHGAIPCHKEHSNSERIILNADVISYYPSLMIEYDYLSRNVPSKQLFIDVYTSRLKAKASGDKLTANALKLILNTTYGASLNQFNDLYDVRMGRSTCITGQVFLIMLIQMLIKVPTFRLIQSNTDGVMFSIDVEYESEGRRVISLWEKETRMNMEIETIQTVVQKDVNNYIAFKSNGKIKVTGAYVKAYHSPFFDCNSLRIVQRAIVDYFLYDFPISYTINKEKDISQFQQILKSGSSYDKVVHKVDWRELPAQRANRVFATKDYGNGAIYKVKIDGKKERFNYFDTSLTQEEYAQQYVASYTGDQRNQTVYNRGLKLYENRKKAFLDIYKGLSPKHQKQVRENVDEKGETFYITDSYSQIAGCPPHAMILNESIEEIGNIDKLDRQYYINLANERIKDFIGGNIPTKKVITVETEIIETVREEQKEEKVMNEQNTVETIANPRIELYKKIFNLGVLLSQVKFELDTRNSHLKYDYAKSEKYRQELGIACRKVGLIYCCNIGNRLFQEIPKSSNMSLTTIQGSMAFIDIDTGEQQVYSFIADGADNLDKGVYKAETMAIKYFVKNNFLLPIDGDELDPESPHGYLPLEETQTVVKVEKPIEQKPKSTKPLSNEQKESAKQEVTKKQVANPVYVEQMKLNLNKILEADVEFGKTETGVKLTKAIHSVNADGDSIMTQLQANKYMTALEKMMDRLGIE